MNRLTVDQNGIGDYTTIGAAISAAVAAGAGSASGAPFFWEILISGDVYQEDITVPIGCILRGCGRQTTTIRGATPVIHSGSRLFDLSISLTAAAVGLTVNTDGLATIVLQDVDVIVDYGHDGDTIGIKLQGAGTGGSGGASGYLYVHGGYLYARNNSGTNPLARCVNVQIASGSNAYAEFLGGSHFKNSASVGAERVLVESLSLEALSGVGMPPGTDWATLGTPDDDRVVLRLPAAKDTAYVGFIGTPVTTVNPSFELEAEMVIDAPAATLHNANFYSHIVRDVRFKQGGTFEEIPAFQEDGEGTEYPLLPHVASNVSPTELDTLPNGVLWIKREIT